jgi:hypothetical protein
MWAVVKGEVGIINAFNDVVAEFHVVNENGTTKEVKLVDPALVAQAPYGEIPKSRRPTKELARKFGYA